MKNKILFKSRLGLVGLFTVAPLFAWGATLDSKWIKEDLSKPDLSAKYWSGIQEETVTLMAQPMVAPRPKETNTSSISVQSLHDGKWISFRLKWKDPEKNEAGRLGEFSDAVAMQFPIKSNENPPPIFMGAKDNPVHLFHWRAQYQRDQEKGKPEMRDLYPNMSVDMYPMDFKDTGHLKAMTDERKEVFSPGKIEGNPQSYRKFAVDEIFAEGFSTSSVSASHEAVGYGKWENGRWTVVISRPLNEGEGGSIL
ncbi:MAG: ethylbenzene dehydrogenase-related protein, partial [Bdellovibrionota bacterium]